MSCLIVAGWVAAGLFTPCAGADVIDFEGLANGQEIGRGSHGEAAQPYADIFVLYGASNGVTTQGAAIFDSDLFGPNAGGADKDLRAGLGSGVRPNDRRLQGLGIDVFLTLVSAIANDEACTLTTEWD